MPSQGKRRRAKIRPVRSAAIALSAIAGTITVFSGCTSTDLGVSPLEPYHSGYPMGQPQQSSQFAAQHFSSAAQPYRPKTVLTDHQLLHPWERFENPALRAFQEMALRNSQMALGDPGAAEQLRARVLQAKQNRGSAYSQAFSPTQLRRELLQEVAMLCAEIRRHQGLLLMASQNRARQSAGLQEATVRMQVGSAGQMDVQQFQTMISRTDAEGAVNHQLFDMGVRRLRDLVGQPLTSAIVQSLIDHPQLFLNDLESQIPAEILRQRCDVRSAEQRVTQLGRQAGIAEAELSPHLGLAGNISASKLPPGAGSADAFDNDILSLDPSTLGIDIGQQRTWHFVTPQSSLGQSSGFRTPLQQSMGNYHQAVTSAADEVQKWLTQYVHTRQRIESLKKTAMNAEKALELATQQFQADRVKADSVLIAQSQIMHTERAIIEAEYQLAKAAIELFIAVGGQCHQDQFPQAVMYEPSL